MSCALQDQIQCGSFIAIALFCDDLDVAILSYTVLKWIATGHQILDHLFASRGNHAYSSVNMAGTFVKIAVPSSLVTYLVLQYFDPRQRGTHSAAMRQKLQGESLSQLVTIQPYAEAIMQMRTSVSAELMVARKCMQVM